MANESEWTWGSETAFAVTDLASLDDGQIWNSVQISQTTTGAQKVRIYYDLDWLGSDTPAAGDTLIFRLCDGGSDGTQRDGNVLATQAKTTDAADVSNFQAACKRVHTHAFLTSNEDPITGSFDIDEPPMYWTLLIEVDTPSGSALAASGASVGHQYGSPQYQTS